MKKVVLGFIGIVALPFLWLSAIAVFDNIERKGILAILGYSFALFIVVAYLGNDKFKDMKSFYVWYAVLTLVLMDLINVFHL